MYIFIFFLIAIGVVLALSRKNIGVSLLLGAIILGIIVPFVSILLGSSFSYPLSAFQGGKEILNAFLEPSTILLALAVGLIPLIGGTMERSGQMDKLVKNMRVPKRAAISSLPAILGMLPMPGGALLSSPLVERTGKDVKGGMKAAINVYFRHVLFLIYPLAPALLVSARIANLNVYTLVPYLLPFFLFSIILGYMFLLRNVKGQIKHEDEFSLKNLVLPLTVILIAPLLDLILTSLFPQTPPFSEIALVIGVIISLVFALRVGGMKINDLWKIFKEMKSWNFALVIFGMFAFLNVFNASPLPDRISDLHILPQLLFVGIGFFLGIGTGRIQAPMGILLPILMAPENSIVTPLAFTIIYFSVFIGYVLSPVHPCVSVSLEYFDTTLEEFSRSILLPVGFAIGTAFIVSFFVSF